MNLSGFPPHPPNYCFVGTLEVGHGIGFTHHRVSGGIGSGDSHALISLEAMQEVVGVQFNQLAGSQKTMGRTSLEDSEKSWSQSVGSRST